MYTGIQTKIKCHIKAFHEAIETLLSFVLWGAVQTTETPTCDLYCNHSTFVLMLMQPSKQEWVWLCPNKTLYIDNKIWTSIIVTLFTDTWFELSAQKKSWQFFKFSSGHQILLINVWWKVFMNWKCYLLFCAGKYKITS